MDDRIKMNQTGIDNGDGHNKTPDKDAVYGGLRCRLDYDNYIKELKSKKNANEAGIKKGLALTFAIVGVLAVIAVVGVLVFNANAAGGTYISGEGNRLIYSGCDYQD